MPAAVWAWGRSRWHVLARFPFTARFRSMDTEPLYCAEQIKVPEGLPELLRVFAKEAIRAQPPPDKLYEWAAQ